MRSDFLVHWTGEKQIESAAPTSPEIRRRKYVDLLVSILKDGFRMEKLNETVWGRNGARIKFTVPATCFTEIRLSQTQLHCKRYGCLGVGVTRKFVLDRFGGPVHYVRNHEAECVVGNLQEILAALNRLENGQDVINYFGINTSFIKNMSTSKNKDDFDHLDEQEWRIPHTDLQTKEGRIVSTGLAEPEFRIPLCPEDVRLIVFPDRETRAEAIADERLRMWFQEPVASPAILLTVEDCECF